MRFAAVLSVIALVLAPGAATAQDDRGPTSPPYYINKDARFAILFPAAPAVSDTTYTTAAGARVPAKLYSVTRSSASLPGLPSTPRRSSMRSTRSSARGCSSISRKPSTSPV
jgi:hypothetical protein